MMQVLSRRAAAAAVAVAVALGVSACTASAPTSGSGQGASGGGDDPYTATLTYWYWGESDAPGANTWMKARAADYTRLHPDVKITIVPQSTDTLIGAFTTAAQTRSGPDIATQWATVPVLSQVWAGAVAPVSDYVSAAQRTTWIGGQENTYQGKLWAVPLYVIGIPLAYNSSLLSRAGVTAPPATLAELLAACGKLRAAGITPIGMGNKDGYFGAWMFSNFGKQQLDDVAELKQAVLGKGDVTDAKYTGYLQVMKDMRDAKCLNDDIASLTLDQGQTKFASGQAAMAWGTDGLVNSWIKQLGAGTVGVVRTPTWGSGKLAQVYNTTQSSSAFVTSWSSHKRAAATFLAWLHEPQNLASWYQATGIFPADTRFDPATITTSVGKQLWDFTKAPGSVWLENYLPPSVDADGNLAAGQAVTSGGSVQQAVDIWRRAAQKWRSQNPVEVKNFTAWATTG